MSVKGKSNSLKLKVDIETTNTAQRKYVTTLVDSGGTSEFIFIDQDYTKSCGFNLIKLTEPIPIHNIDGTLNEASSVTEVVRL